MLPKSSTTLQKTKNWAYQDKHLLFAFDPVLFYRYRELCDSNYDFETGDFSMETGHFTQVVWKSSITLGIGKAVVPKGGMKCTYIVARYRPPGNYMGQFQNEVSPGTFSQSLCSKLDDMLKDISNAPGAGLPPQGPPVSNPSVSQDTVKSPGTKGNN